jgi:heterodisulfide reductase subunit C
MDFGYQINPSSAVNLDQVDRRRYDALVRLSPDAATCMGCGSCSATCTGAPFSGMSLRKVILAIQRGKEREAREMLSGCMLCGKCTMVCPRGINTRHLILSIGKVYKMEDKAL